MALYNNYHAPLEIYSKFYFYAQNNHIGNGMVCIGKEVYICILIYKWYRFPSHYFVYGDINVGFIKNGFDGQLPKYFNKINGTFQIPKGMNDLNVQDSTSLVISFNI